MATKKAAPTDDELLAQLDNLSTQATARPPKPSSRTPRHGQTAQSSQSEQDLLAELGNLAQRPASRPSTPALKPTPQSAANRSPIHTSAPTPPPGRTSEEKSSNNGQRKSGDSMRSFHQSFTPATTSTEDSAEADLQPEPAPAKSGGWWGGILSTATAAVSQAQAAVKEIQKNEDAHKWADQVRGNVGILRGFGDELRSMAVPTFHNILQTIAPPISSHERLQIHITHDLSNYPTLDPLIYQVFSRVMAQVEGGDLMVVQRGNEAGPKRGSSDASRDLGSWHDGPWWRSGERRSTNAIRGATEGSKLVRASAEGYAEEYFASRGGVEQAAKRATETLSDSNPTRDSQIFLAVQAISQPVPKDMFAQASASEQEGQIKEAPSDKDEEEIVFAIYLHDPIHGIAFQAVSQALPAQWIEWLDAPSGGEGTLPESIEEILAGGGIDPREWVSEWVEETLSLVVSVVAQRYVARRMGVGESGGRKGKLRADLGQEAITQSGGGEAARALGGM
ncbi:maintenance of telomere capping protein 1 [Exophiala viscosa]|uniref:Maintenance of telomere capping protein 1 n=1 Tax=Exophiala viscosa TaxID=2486360 RepID=A0AAN6DTN4_9EURO|nr:maintenance of telomere capping protein 1 [Exophiala viscosa]